MLSRLRVEGFKSLAELSLDLPPFAVLFGPNAAGKSNVLDAIFLLKRLATQRTVAEALGSEIRGYPAEQLTFPRGGLRELFAKNSESLALEADLVLREQQDGEARSASDRRSADGQKRRRQEIQRVRYRARVQIEPRSGKASIVDEYLARLSVRNEPLGLAAIERDDGQMLVRREDGHRPQKEHVGQGHTIVSDPRRGPPAFRTIERARREFESIRTYYLDPRVAMRSEVPPQEVHDIGTYGQHLAQFLYTLKNSEHQKYFAAVRRTLKAVIPSVQDFSVELDQARGTLDLEIVQNGLPFSKRMVSEGTLRVLAIAAIAVNPWPSSVIAFEEPENGVHLRRLELIAELLSALAIERGRQVIVTTHSPHFCQQVLRIQSKHPKEVGLFVVRHSEGRTDCHPFSATGPLFQNDEVRQQLVKATDDGWFQGLVLRGLVDG